MAGHTLSHNASANKRKNINYINRIFYDVINIYQLQILKYKITNLNKKLGTLRMIERNRGKIYLRSEKFPEGAGLVFGLLICAVFWSLLLAGLFLIF